VVREQEGKGGLVLFRKTWRVGGRDPLIPNLRAGWEESASRSCRFIPKEGTPSTHRISFGWAVPIKGRATRDDPLQGVLKHHWDNRKYSASKRGTLWRSG
jgi:hypothetical protein